MDENCLPLVLLQARSTTIAAVIERNSGTSTVTFIGSTLYVIRALGSMKELNEFENLLYSRGWALTKYRSNKKRMYFLFEKGMAF